MFPKMEIEWWPCASTEHRADRQQIEARIAELEKNWRLREETNRQVRFNIVVTYSFLR